MTEPEFPSTMLRACAESFTILAATFAKHGGTPDQIAASYKGADTCLQAITAYEQLSDRFLAERTEHSATVGRLLARIAQLSQGISELRGAA